MEYKYLDREHALVPAKLPAQQEKHSFTTKEIVDAMDTILSR
jgi:hypothetical protein